MPHQSIFDTQQLSQDENLESCLFLLGDAFYPVFGSVQLSFATDPPNTSQRISDTIFWASRAHYHHNGIEFYSPYNLHASWYQSSFHNPSCVTGIRTPSGTWNNSCSRTDGVSTPATLHASVHEQARSMFVWTVLAVQAHTQPPTPHHITHHIVSTT